MGGAPGPARIYPKADHSSQWWENDFDRGTFSGIEKILLHTTETTSWPGYKAGASAPTLTYHPRQRAWRQHNYLDRSARALVDPSSTPVRENRDNVIQIEIVCYSDENVAGTVGGLKVSDLTDAQLGDLADFIKFIRAEYGGPPLVAPKFLPYPQSYGNSSVRMTGSEYDAFKGVLGHQHASGNDHGDPGSLNVARILQLAGGTATATTTGDDDVSATDVWNYPLEWADGRSAVAGNVLKSAFTQSSEASNKADVAIAAVQALAKALGPTVEEAVKDALTAAVVDVNVNFPAPAPEPAPAP